MPTAVTRSLWYSSVTAADVSDVSSAGAEKESTRSDLLIVGAADRNRAVHGDVVVVALRPRAQWRHRSARLAEEEEPDGEAEGEPQPTARVVGVLRRGWGEYVVSLQASCPQGANQG